MTRVFCEIDGLSIEYTVSGNGDIPVLLLHGWGSSFDVYKGIFAALDDRCKLYALNFPGCGKSDVMKTPWKLEDYCELVLKFINMQNIENPILIGHSHGGRVILKLTADKLLSPPKIVLLDAAGLIPEKSFKQKFRAKSFKAIKTVLKPLGSLGEPLMKKAREHYGSADYLAAPPVLRQTLVSLVNTDLRDILKNISCPSLLIWGENDTATPLADAKIMESLIPDAGLCVIKGTGHYSFCEKPYEAHAILRSFIK